MYLILSKPMSFKENVMRNRIGLMLTLVFSLTSLFSLAQQDAQQKSPAGQQNTSSACSFSIADTISGNKEACTFIGTTGGDATYSINAVSATYYVWSVSNATTMQIISGQGTPNVTVRFTGNYGIGTLSVKVGNNCGPEINRSALILKGPPPIPGEITGEATACPYINYDTTALYFINKVTNATGYQWTVPQGITIVGRPGGIGTPNDTAIIVKFDNTFVAGTFITVNGVSRCGLSSPKNFTINRSWSPVPESITGPTNSCVIKAGLNNPGGTPVVYRTNKVRYAVSYLWSVPPGATIVSPVMGSSINVRDTSITVVFGSSYAGGFVSVQSVTGCGVSPLRSIQVNDQVLGTPISISGTLNPCPTIGGPDTTTYRIRKVEDATSYAWNVPVGATIVGRPGGAGTPNDTIILVRWNAAFTTGTIDVSAVNNCMTSTTRSLTLIRKMPTTPNGIMVATMRTCPYRQYAYMISGLPANSNSVVWSVPPGATILSGQGTLTIKVEYAATAINGNITVTGVNSCGLGTPRTLAISLPACPSPRTIFSRTEKMTDIFSADIFETKIFPNPGTTFNISVPSNSREKIHLSITDVSGSIQNRYSISPNETFQFGEQLMPGMYFVRIRQGAHVVTKKIIKL